MFAVIVNVNIYPKMSHGLLYPEFRKQMEISVKTS